MNNLPYFGMPVMDVPAIGAPVMYDYLNSANSIISPSTVHVSNTGLAHFFRRYLLQKAMSVFKWKLPENWSKEYFLYILYCWGYLSIINTNKFGVIPQACGLRGYDVFYRPNVAVITNPLLNGMKELKIDIQCTLFKLQPDYGGIMDIVNYYADMMALCAETASVNLINSKLSYVFGADDKAAAETFKKLYDDVASGKPCVVTGKNLFKQDGTPAWNMFSQNVGQNYIVGDILSDMRKIESMFLTAIGIPNANTDKKERLIQDEVNANNEETQTLCELWLEQLQEACKKTRDMFGIKIFVNWRIKPNTKKEDKKEDDKGGDVE
jgi:hypothetical protein